MRSQQVNINYENVFLGRKWECADDNANACYYINVYVMKLKHDCATAAMNTPNITWQQRIRLGEGADNRDYTLKW